MKKCLRWGSAVVAILALAAVHVPRAYTAMFQPFHFDDSISPFTDQVNFRSPNFSAHDLRSDTEFTTPTKFYSPRDYTDNVVSQYGDSQSFYSHRDDLHDGLYPLGNDAP